MQNGQLILRNRHTPPQVAITKWSTTLPSDFTFNWLEAWDGESVQKECGLIWQLWH
jgi:hypothetical protein